ncbi:MAG: ATP-dependent 6-phosphofructokinase [Acidobacteriota bacterium]|nr:ATP-dependent 6-phosphofructokinase [Acidobacteriota bacterium]
MAKKSNGTIGILTGGGDCPGLNPVIRAVVRRAEMLDYKILGIKNGWLGLVKGITEPLSIMSVSGILPRGGTILGTSRTNPLKNPDDKKLVVANLKKFKIDYLIAVGGEDTLGVARKLASEGLKVVGVPKTIDNDIEGTDQTFGFDTAVSIVTEAIDRLHTTAESHQRVMVVEVMGRHTGWIAIAGGLAGGADCILIPERPMTTAQICEILKKRHARGRLFSIVVVAEGFNLAGDSDVITKDQQVDQFGHVRLGGIGEVVAREIERMTGYETRVTVLGHVQRGGSPTAYDRVLGTRYGVKAVDLIHEGKLGAMVCLKGNRITSIPIKNAMTKLKYVDSDLIETAEIFYS